MDSSVIKNTEIHKIDDTKKNYVWFLFKYKKIKCRIKRFILSCLRIIHDMSSILGEEQTGGFYAAWHAKLVMFVYTFHESEKWLNDWHSIAWWNDQLSDIQLCGKMIDHLMFNCEGTSLDSTSESPTFRVLFRVPDSLSGHGLPDISRSLVESGTVYMSHHRLLWVQIHHQCWK